MSFGQRDVSIWVNMSAFRMSLSSAAGRRAEHHSRTAILAATDLSRRIAGVAAAGVPLTGDVTAEGRCRHRRSGVVGIGREHVGENGGRADLDVTGRGEQHQPAMVGELAQVPQDLLLLGTGDLGAVAPAELGEPVPVVAVPLAQFG
jgi:hypothetical protein